MRGAWEDATDVELLASCHAHGDRFADFYRRHERIVAGWLIRRCGRPEFAADLPWGMRVVHTTRGYLCLELGRVDAGRLGELGIDGTFHNDGLFHPLPLDSLPEGRGIGFDHTITAA